MIDDQKRLAALRERLSGTIRPRQGVLLGEIALQGGVHDAPQALIDELAMLNCEADEVLEEIATLDHRLGSGKGGEAAP